MNTERVEVGGVAIQEEDVRALSEDEIVALNTFSNILREESNPEDPPRPLELTRAGIRTIPESTVIRFFVARDPDGSWAGVGEASWMKVEENKHLLDIGMSVRPDRRMRGIGKTLLRLLADVAEEEQRTLIMSWSSAHVPAGEAFAKRVGAEAGLEQHTNRLLIADVDRDLVGKWIDEGPARAQGYSHMAIDGPYPDEHVERIRAIHEVMNTAPRDNLEMEDWKITVEHLREWERSMSASGTERWSLFARHDETGDIVGFTEVAWNPANTKVVWQMGTAVRPEHRGHALGKWLKAAMIERVLSDRPEAEEIRTGNADSNDAMLGINRQLGFKTYQAHTVWQVPLEKVKAYLGVSV